MKNRYTIFIVMLLICSLSKAQTTDDAFRFNQRKVTGTARSMAMSNAFGALGGDLSSLSLNPAGIAVYRTSEFAFTPSLSYNSTEADYSNNINKDDKYIFPFNQIGIATTYRPMRDNDNGIISTHFAFTYTRTADYNSNTLISGHNITDEYTSQGLVAKNLLSAIMLEANGKLPTYLEGTTYWAYDNYLLDLIDPNGDQYFTAYEGIDEASNEIFPLHANGVNQIKHIQTSGYQGEYGFTFGMNISKFLLLGASVNFQNLKYNEQSTFNEINNWERNDPPYDTQVNNIDSYFNLNQDGFGVNAKVGAILNLHPIRLGASFHLPTFYNIDETFDSQLNAYYLDGYTTESYITSFEYSYNYRTPYRANGSLALVIGKIGLISVDYEMTDHKSSKFTIKDGYDQYFRDLNEEIKNQFKMTHDLRVGLEVKPTSFIALRAGVAYIDSPLKKEYTNGIDPSHISMSGGLGFRNKKFFCDLAYSLSNYESSYFLNEGGVRFGDAATISSSIHQAAFTFGWKF